jgi:hypothetical protein
MRRRGIGGLDKTRTYDNFDIISSINLLTMLS